MSFDPMKPRPPAASLISISRFMPWACPGLGLLCFLAGLVAPCGGNAHGGADYAITQVALLRGVDELYSFTAATISLSTPLIEGSDIPSRSFDNVALRCDDRVFKHFAPVHGAPLPFPGPARLIPLHGKRARGVGVRLDESLSDLLNATKLPMYVQPFLSVLASIRFPHGPG
jgi:hypothetical protein